MQSRLLVNLDVALRESEDRRAWARTMCRRASQFARQDNGRAAMTAIQQVRDEYSKTLEPEAATWLFLAEAILAYFGQDLNRALDRARRAYGISVSFDIQNARPSCLAWLSHFEFNDCRYEEMGPHLKEGLGRAPGDDHQALSRLSLVVADSFNLAGDAGRARHWYESTRRHAIAEGDEATLSAMLYNVAAYRTSNARLADAIDGYLPEDARRAEMEAASAANFDAAIGTSGLSLLMPLLQGQIRTVRREYEAALQILDGVAPEKLLPKFRALPLVDRAWCHSNLGAVEIAKAIVSEAVGAISETPDPDDLAYVHARIAQVMATCGNKEDAIKHMDLAREYLARHREIQARLIAIVDAAVAAVQPT